MATLLFRPLPSCAPGSLPAACHLSPPQEYESNSSGSEPDAGLENQYYDAKGKKEDDPEEAIEGFRGVVDAEGEEKGEWGFKAHKQMCKMHFRAGEYGQMMETYKSLLTYIKAAVTRNYSEKSINSILDYVSASQQMTLLQEFYETTLDALKDARNDRLWFKTNIKVRRVDAWHTFPCRTRPSRWQGATVYTAAHGVLDRSSTTLVYGCSLARCTWTMVASTRASGGF